MAQAASCNTANPDLKELRQYLTIFDVDTKENNDKLMEWQGLPCINNFKSFSRKDSKIMIYLHNQAEGIANVLKKPIISKSVHQ